MKSVRLACQAMGTRFELVLHGDDAVRLRAAGEEAIDEIKRLHNQLSIFRPNSVLSLVNSKAFGEPIQLRPELFQLLRRIGRLSHITEGAFDVTVGPLLEVWGFRDKMGGLSDNSADDSADDPPEDRADDLGGDSPDETDISEALERVGFGHVTLEETTRSVTFDHPGIRLDLGGVGKGHALDAAARILASAGISCGLLHGGTSSVLAIGLDPSGVPWKIAVRRPFADPDERPLGIVTLEDEAMAVSAGSGRFYEAEGRMVGHVVDPRSGYPVRVADLAVVVASDATDADALATGLLVLGADGLRRLDQRERDLDEFGTIDFRGAVLADSVLVQKGGTVIIE